MTFPKHREARRFRLLKKKLLIAETDRGKIVVVRKR